MMKNGIISENRRLIQIRFRRVFSHCMKLDARNVTASFASWIICWSTLI